MLRYFFVLALSVVVSLNAKIIESNTIHDVTAYKTPETLIIYDIDNTLIEPTQTLGSDQWFSHRFSELKEYHEDHDEALSKALTEWMAIQSFSTMKVVEPGAEALIEKQQQKGEIVMGLTTREVTFAECTLNQLKSLGINLAPTAPTKEEMFFRARELTLFRDGVLFTSGGHKGEALFKFLRKAKYKPKHIVFINDKAENLGQVEETCKKKRIPFIGLRYGYTDHKVKNFKKELAEVQQANFGSLMSDEEAVGLLEKKERS